MTTSSQRDALRAFISTRFLNDKASISDDELLYENQIVDSLGMIQLIAWIETTFAVSAKPSEITIKNFGSVDAIMAFIGRKHSAPPGRTSVSPS